MRSDKYKDMESKRSLSNDSWEETQLLFKDRDRQREAMKRREEYEARRERDAAYQEYLEMRKNPDANRSPEYDRDRRASAYTSAYDRKRQSDVQRAAGDAYAKERVKKKKPILEEQPDRYEKKEQRQNKERNRREVEEYNRIRQEEAKAQKKRRKKGYDDGSNRGRKKGRVRRFLAVLLLLIVIGAAVAFVFANSMLSKVGDLDIDKSNLGIDPVVADSLQDYRNIALLGVDARDMSDYSNCRSDAIIIMSIDKDNGEIRQISVYRDTYLYVDENYGYNKITNVHSNAGTEATIRTLNKNMDLNIEEVVIVNWKAVADAVDGLGGVEIDVQESELNELNKITLHTQSIIGGSTDTVNAAGLQTLNGNQAVAYARIRKDSAMGDYRRNERMKIMLSATIDKAKHTNPLVLNQIANNVLPQIKTNMSNTDMMAVMMSILTKDMTGSTGWPFEITGWSSNAWYGVPDTLESNVVELHETYFGQPGYIVTNTVQEISKNISYRTGIY